MSRVRYIDQNLVDVYHPSISVDRIDETDLTEEYLDQFFADKKPSPPRFIGIAASYTPKGKIAVLAVSFLEKIFIVEFRGAGSEAAIGARSLLQEKILCSEDNDIVAFDIAPIALSLFSDKNLRMTTGIDFQSIGGDATALRRDPVLAIKFVVAGTKAESSIYHENIRTAFRDPIWDASNRSCEIWLALRAWAAGFFPTLDGSLEEKFRQIARVNTALRSELVSLGV